LSKQKYPTRDELLSRYFAHDGPLYVNHFRNVGGGVSRVIAPHPFLVSEQIRDGCLHEWRECEPAMEREYYTRRVGEELVAVYGLGNDEQ